jgi:hypothetical protein
MEASRKILNCADVMTYGSLCVIATLEFFQHHFAKSGHKKTSYDPTTYPINKQPLLHEPHAKRPPQSGLVQVGFSSTGRWRILS